MKKEEINKQIGKRCCWLCVFAVAFQLHLSALTYTKADSLQVVSLLEKAQRQPEGTNYVLFFARQFEGIPYVAATLEINREEELVVNLRQMDCTTVVENAVALALTVREEHPTFAAFCRNLEKIRYHDGKIDGYASRNHYFSEWIAGNARQGIVTEMTGKESEGHHPFVAKQQLSLNYMSTHAEAYPMLRGNNDEIVRIREHEQRLKGIEVRYIPLSLLDKGKTVLGDIRDGDILAIVTRKNGLDTSHVGLAVWQNDCLHLLNASSIHKKVVLEPMTLAQYMRRHPSQLGVRVIRVI